MPTRKTKTDPVDANRLAFLIVSELTGDEEREPVSASTKPGLTPLAVASIHARLGGEKGGPARAKKLTPEERSEIARKAARARWSGKKPGTGKRR